ncbi:uncharacterized mitochondrial protein AtMg00860-like [Rutidosis leptorrhynchoides]|uniref:uncharacterized mitochondrial protein AtMg00860-like n=1 Tax=Rutidosis leptorrhynchoides TaxID=125765 RepID=UPI003A999653
MDEHVTHLKSVLQILRDHQFFVKASKCSYAVDIIDCLGHIINAQGVAPDPAKVTAMTQWPTPENTKQLKGFLGLTGYYRKFIKGYAEIASPVTNLLKKDNFLWSKEAEESFQTLKQRMVTAPVLMLPNFNLPFQVETDASGIALGAVLLQEKHPIAYFSKKFSLKLQRSSTYIRELHAMIAATAKWRQYLLGSKITIFTDHKSLKSLIGANNLDT